MRIAVVFLTAAVATPPLAARARIRPIAPPRPPRDAGVAIVTGI